MSAIVFQDYADDRADLLAARDLNGLRLALVTLAAGAAPDHAELELHFHNALHVADLLADLAAEPAQLARVFRVRGGTRVPAGLASGQIRVTAITPIDAVRVRLRVEPVGDYSTYTLELVWDASRIDPFFSRLGFKFRPGCFTNDCAPRVGGRPSVAAPVIDYLAKDYDSFRHVLMTAVAQRVPGWRSTSEADHDQVLIDLFAAAADELSDYQDRVMAEAYLATARGRVALARHARLMDYHLGQGCQASTWLVLELDAGQAPFALSDQDLVVRTAGEDEAVFFASHQRWLDDAARQHFDALRNRLRLHTWRDAQPALRAGSTSADVVPLAGLASQAQAETLRDAVRDGLWRECVIAEMLNPLTGAAPGRNPRKRQLLRLRNGAEAADAIFDPVTLTWMVRLHWRDEDALRFEYSFTTFCGGAPVTDVSLFFGNLLPVRAGLPMTVHFHEPGTVLPDDGATLRHRHFQRMNRFGDGLDWVLAALPDDMPLAYLPAPDGTVADGSLPPRSTLRVEVATPDGLEDIWDEVETLVRSDDSAERGDHLMVETDEHGRSTLRFGNGRNGRLLPGGAVVRCAYQIAQVGGGLAGNVGADRLTVVSALAPPLAGAVVAAWNPFDVTDGRAPETPDKIRRNAPEAWRTRQLRAVTLDDYVRRAEEVAGVARAVAQYAWTGSWRTVRVVIDPRATTVVNDALRREVAAHLEAVRLIGEDLELRAPRYVALDVRITVCAEPEYWCEDLRFVLEQEFSDGWTADGRPGFFNPDQWSFGQSVHRSAIAGRIHQVAGVRHIVDIAMKRFNAPTPGLPGTAVLEMGFDEVVLLSNDPSHLERGLIRFDVRGGRQ